MKTQTPSKKHNWRGAAGFLALALGGLLVLSSCHHGVYGQPRRPHPHIAVHHRHAPDAFVGDYYGHGGRGKAVVASNTDDSQDWAHCHTTRRALFRQPNVRHTLGF